MATKKPPKHTKRIDFQDDPIGFLDAITDTTPRTPRGSQRAAAPLASEEGEGFLSDLRYSPTASPEKTTIEQKNTSNAEGPSSAVRSKQERMAQLKHTRETHGFPTTLNLPPQTSPIVRLQAEWAKALAAHTTVRTAHWDKYDLGYVENLLKLYEGDEATIAAALRYLVELWGPICQRFTKSVGAVPTVSLLHRFHAEIVNEALVYAEWQDASAQYESAMQEALQLLGRDDPRRMGLILPIPIDQDPAVRKHIPDVVRARYERAKKTKDTATGASWARGVR